MATYEELSRQSGREPVYLVQIGLPRCNLRFGIAPCKATTNGNPNRKCYQSWETCLDRDAYANDASLNTLYVQFASRRLDLPGTDQIDVFPVLTSVNTTPTSLNVGEGFSARETCDITFNDFPSSDTYMDPYYKERTYDPLEIGTMFSKLKARYPYLEGSTVFVYTGYMQDDGTFDIFETKRRRYVLDRIEGPDANGKVVMKCKDPLALAYNSKAEAPLPTNVLLRADISSNQTVFTSTDYENKDSTVFNVGDYIRMDDEVMQITNYNIGNGNITVSRATMPPWYRNTAMIAQPHDEGTNIQLCKLYEEMNVVDVVYDLLVNYANVPASFINLTEWQAFATEWMQDYVYNRLLTEPVGITELLDDICKNNVMVWWDSRGETMRIDSLRPRTDAEVPVFSDNNSIIENSFRQQQDRNSRASQVWFHYGLRTPVLEVDKLINYAALEINIDTESESEFEYNQKSILKLHNEWLPAPLGSFVVNEARAEAISGRAVRWNKDTKIIVAVSVDAKDMADTWTGSVVDLDTRFLQDFNGFNEITRFLVTEVKETLDDRGNRYTLKLMSTGVIRGRDRTGLITPNEDPENLGNPFPDYLDASQTLRDKYAFISTDTIPSLMTNGDYPYRIA